MAQSGTHNGVLWGFTSPREAGIEQPDCGPQTGSRHFESMQVISVTLTSVAFELVHLNLLDRTKKISAFAFTQIRYIWPLAQATGHVGYGMSKRVLVYVFSWAIKVQYRH